MQVEKTIQEFMADLASNLPAPGGGGVAAISGALGAGLVAMVCHLTIGKKGYEQSWEDLKVSLAESDKLRQRLLELVDEDARAFTRVIEAFKMPKENPGEQEKRAAAIQSAYRIAADVPFDIASQCCQVLKLALPLVDQANVNAISDIGVAAYTAYAGVESAIMNVNINLPSIKDEEYVKLRTSQLEKILTEAADLRDQISQQVNKELGR